MSDFVFQDFDGFEGFAVTKSRPVKNKNKKTDALPMIKAFVAILLVILVCEFFVYFFIVPRMKKVEIYFNGLSTFTEEQMRNIVGETADKTFLAFDISDVKSRIANIAGIEDVKVEKHFPNRVYITVKEREAVAMTFAQLGERTVLVQIDKNGVLFPINKDKAPLAGTIPLISGFPIDNIPEGMRIPQMYRALIEQIARIQMLPQKYFVAISEIQVIPKEYGNYELVLYPIHSRTRILTGRQLNEHDLVRMMIALDVVNKVEPNVAEIDLRYGAVSYRKHSSEYMPVGESGE